MRRATLDDADEISSVQVESWRAAYKHVYPADYLAGPSVDERREPWTLLALRRTLELRRRREAEER